MKLSFFARYRCPENSQELYGRLLRAQCQILPVDTVAGREYRFMNESLHFDICGEPVVMGAA